MADERVDYGKNVLPFKPLVGEAGLSHTSGGGGGDGMEARIAKLESDIGYLKGRIDESAANIRSIDEKLSGQRAELAVLTERASHFATKTHSVIVAFAMVAALSGLILFAERLKGLLGL